MGNIVRHVSTGNRVGNKRKRSVRVEHAEDGFESSRREGGFYMLVG